MILPPYNTKDIFTKFIFSKCHIAIFLIMIIPRTGIQGRLIFVTGEIGTLFSEKMLESKRMKKNREVEKWKG